MSPTARVSRKRRMSASVSFGPDRPKTNCCPTRVSRSLTNAIIGWRRLANLDLRQRSTVRRLTPTWPPRRPAVPNDTYEFPHFRFRADLARRLHLFPLVRRNEGESLMRRWLTAGVIGTLMARLGGGSAAPAPTKVHALRDARHT